MRYFLPELTFQRGSLPVDKLGGLPWGMPSDLWPLCKACAKPQSLLAQFSHHDQRLARPGHRRGRASSSERRCSAPTQGGDEPAGCGGGESSPPGKCHCRCGDGRIRSLARYDQLLRGRSGALSHQRIAESDAVGHRARATNCGLSEPTCSRCSSSCIDPPNADAFPWRRRRVASA